LTVSKYNTVDQLRDDSIFSYEQIEKTLDTLEEMVLILRRRQSIAREGMKAMEYSAQGMQYEAELEYLHDEFDKLNELIYQTCRLKLNFYPNLCSDDEKKEANSRSVTLTDHSGGKTGDDAVIGKATFEDK
jgi:hypothetical protein